MRDKWLPEGQFSLVEMDVTNDPLYARFVGMREEWSWGGWTTATGTWSGPRTLEMTFIFTCVLGIPTRALSQRGGSRGLNPAYREWHVRTSS